MNKKIRLAAAVFAALVIGFVLHSCAPAAGGGGVNAVSFDPANPTAIGNGVIRLKNAPHTTYTTFAAAIVAVPDNTPTVLEISGYFPIEEEITIPSNKKIELHVLDGKIAALMRDPAYTGYCINIASSSSSLTLNPETGGGTLILDGNKSVVAYPFVYTSGRFTMNTGVTIQNNVSNHYGSGVSMSNIGIFYMRGGTIRDNKAPSGGGVASIYSGSSFYMQGGIISGNTASDVSYSGNGGGVFLTERAVGSYFSKTGGIIYGSEDTVPVELRNTATAGSAVYISKLDFSISEKKNTTASSDVNLFFPVTLNAENWD